MSTVFSPRPRRCIVYLDGKRNMGADRMVVQRLQASLRQTSAQWLKSTLGVDLDRDFFAYLMPTSISFDVASIYRDAYDVVRTATKSYQSIIWIVYSMGHSILRHMMSVDKEMYGKTEHVLAYAPLTYSTRVPVVRHALDRNYLDTVRALGLLGGTRLSPHTFQLRRQLRLLKGRALSSHPPFRCVYVLPTEDYILDNTAVLTECRDAFIEHGTRSNKYVVVVNGTHLTAFERLIGSLLQPAIHPTARTLRHLNYLTGDGTVVPVSRPSSIQCMQPTIRLPGSSRNQETALVHSIDVVPPPVVSILDRYYEIGTPFNGCRDDASASSVLIGSLLYRSLHPRSFALTCPSDRRFVGNVRITCQLVRRPAYDNMPVTALLFAQTGPQQLHIIGERTQFASRRHRLLEFVIGPVIACSSRVSFGLFTTPDWTAVSWHRPLIEWNAPSPHHLTVRNLKVYTDIINR